MKPSIDFELSKLYLTNQHKAICVFCSSSTIIDEKYKIIATQLGTSIVKSGFNLVHGGGKVGLMGIIATSVQKAGGKVTGILPETLNIEGIATETDDEIIITRDMADRKAEMRKRSAAFIVLPGGFGTLEEFLETVTLKQLNYLDKPIVLLNVYHYFDFLIQFLQKANGEGFITNEHLNLFYITDNIEDALSYIIEKVNV